MGGVTLGIYAIHQTIITLLTSWFNIALLAIALLAVCMLLVGDGFGYKLFVLSAD